MAILEYDERTPLSLYTLRDMFVRPGLYEPFRTICERPMNTRSSWRHFSRSLCKKSSSGMPSGMSRLSMPIVFFMPLSNASDRRGTQGADRCGVGLSRLAVYRCAPEKRCRVLPDDVRLAPSTAAYCWLGASFQQVARIAYVDARREAQADDARG